MPNVGRVDLIGAQDEAIYLEFSTRKIAALGLDTSRSSPRSRRRTPSRPPASCRPGRSASPCASAGSSRSEESLRAINLRVNDRFFPLTDVATIRRGYVDPPTTLFRFNGEPAIGLAIGMKPGSNLLEFGAALEKEDGAKIKRTCRSASTSIAFPTSRRWSTRRCRASRARCSRPSSSCSASVSSAWACAPGWWWPSPFRWCSPSPFWSWRMTGISLQRISLGALIIALGLLVDDAMIAVEMMVARLEVGDDLRKAATYVYTSTAFPMLTGTLVTVAGFIPIGLNTSAAGEFTFTLFVVIAVSLVVSWIVAVLFTPLLGVTMLPETMKGHHETGKSVVRQRCSTARWMFCMRWRWLTIGGDASRAFVLAHRSA